MPPWQNMRLQPVMTLSVGVRLGPYEIVEPVGAGGMGEVYKARDRRLDRVVAIKILREHLAADPNRRARFDREARAISKLNHPHICTLYDVGHDNGTDYLVVEYLDGQSLAERLQKGALPIEQALPMAIQIAGALDAAHRAGIVHRDLKPANIMLTKAGAKLLDFGIARTGVSLGSSVTAAAAADTMTADGMVLGTVHYMAPEQLDGRDADARSDIFAFGAVLYEILTGARAFAGESQSRVVAAVLEHDPAPLTAIQPRTPPAVARIVTKCLEKNADDRWQTTHDLLDELKWTADRPAQHSTPPAPSSKWMAWSTVAVVLLAIAGVTGSRWMPRPPVAPIYASIEAPDDYVLGEDDLGASLPTRTPMVFTPDGRSLIIQAARAGKPQLFLRSLDQPDMVPIAGTDDARVPFVSPDGKWIGFWTAGELRKAPLTGGAPTTICKIPGINIGPDGAFWGPGDIIVFGDDESGSIMRVSANGGTPAPVTAPPGPERRHVTPFILRDGKRVLFSDVSAVDANDARLMVQRLDGNDARLVVEQATDGRILPTGRLAFMRLGTLMTAAFDMARASVTGDAVQGLDRVMQSGLTGRAGATNTGAGLFAVSSLGTLAVVRGSLVGAPERTLIWTTRDGRTSSAEPPSGAPVGGRLTTRIAPDRSRAIVSVQAPMRREWWLADWTRNAWTVCGDCSSDLAAVAWSPDGRRLLFGKASTMIAHTLDASAGDAVVLREANHTLLPTAWLRDGRIVYLDSSPSTPDREIKLLEPGGSAGRVIVPAGLHMDGYVSPDGRWLAYTEGRRLGQNGRLNNVVVQAFPGPGARTQVSSGGGSNPAWSADGRTLYYLHQTRPNPVASVFSVEIHGAAGTPAAGTPHELFLPMDAQGCLPIRCFDFTPDGPTFLFRSGAKRASVTRIDLVLNWAAALPGGGSR